MSYLRVQILPQSPILMVTLRHTLTQGSINRHQILPQSPILYLEDNVNNQHTHNPRSTQILPQSPILILVLNTKKDNRELKLDIRFSLKVLYLSLREPNQHTKSNPRDIRFPQSPILVIMELLTNKELW
jgi:hypothetical protein